jgi:hypothetical protein
MFSRAIFEDLDFPAMALVVCSKEKVAHKFDRLTHTGDGRKRPQRMGVKER